MDLTEYVTTRDDNIPNKSSNNFNTENHLNRKYIDIGLFNFNSKPMILKGALNKPTKGNINTNNNKNSKQFLLKGEEGSNKQNKSREKFEVNYSNKILRTNYSNNSRTLINQTPLTNRISSRDKCKEKTNIIKRIKQDNLKKQGKTLRGNSNKKQIFQETENDPVVVLGGKDLCNRNRAVSNFLQEKFQRKLEGKRWYNNYKPDSNENSMLEEKTNVNIFIESDKSIIINKQKRIMFDKLKDIKESLFSLLNQEKNYNQNTNAKENRSIINSNNSGNNNANTSRLKKMFFIENKYSDLLGNFAFNKN